MWTPQKLGPPASGYPYRLHHQARPQDDKIVASFLQPSAFALFVIDREHGFDMSKTADILYGSCLCGRVGYRVPRNSVASQMAHCHCVDCQKFHGAAFSTFAETDHFEWVKGEQDHLRTFVLPSNGSIRQFCQTCGSSLTFRGKNQTTIEFALATLDTPFNDAVPDAHLFCKSQLSWTPISESDGLPRYSGGRDTKPT
jgi:hypothetical protein